MRVLIIYAHPSEKSFTCALKDAFIRGIKSAGGEYEVSDLYKMGFVTDLSKAEYEREAFYRDDLPLAADVVCEQEKIMRADCMAFIYPVFWTEAPAKLVGYFDRVWTYGFAYGKKTMPTLKRTYFLCSCGNSIEYLTKFGHLESMKRVMIGDRMYERSAESVFTAFDEMSRDYPFTPNPAHTRDANWDKNLLRAQELGARICAP